MAAPRLAKGTMSTDPTAVVDAHGRPLTDPVALSAVREKVLSALRPLES